MRAYGYEVDDRGEQPQLLSLREVSLSCSFDDMRRIARFASEVVAMIDSGDVKPLPGWHRHFRDLEAGWSGAKWTGDEDDFILAWNGED